MQDSLFIIIVASPIHSFIHSLTLSLSLSLSLSHTHTHTQTLSRFKISTITRISTQDIAKAECENRPTSDLWNHPTDLDNAKGKLHQNTAGHVHIHRSLPQRTAT